MAAPARIDATESERRQPTILVVDDAPLLRELAETFLSNTGHIVTATDGADALERVGEEAPDLVITDMEMPRLDGTELCQRLREDPATCAIPLIAMIREDHEHDHARAIRAGAREVLTKPISRPTLVETVRRYIQFDPPRAQPRVPIATPTEIASPEEATRGHMANLSRGGCFVEAQEPAKAGREVDLDFELPGRSGEMIRATAQIVWRRAEAHEGMPPGIGLRFVELGTEELHAIDRFVHERLDVAEW